MALAIETKLGVPVFCNALVDLIAEAQDVDAADVLTILKAVVAENAGEPVAIPARLRMVWQMISKDLARVRQMRKIKKADAEPSSTTPNHDAPSDTIANHAEPSSTTPNHDAPSDTLNVNGNGNINVNIKYSPPPPSGGTARVARKGPDDVGNDFERFWEAYGKRGVRKTAATAFAKARKAKSWPGIDRICELLAVLRSSHDWTKDNGQFQPHAATWLNQERWNDELPPEAKAEAEREAKLNAPLPHYDFT